MRGRRDRTSNSDPVTGQAGWYDVRVRIYKAAADEPEAVLAAVRRHAGAAGHGNPVRARSGSHKLAEERGYQ